MKGRILITLCLFILYSCSETGFYEYASDMGNFRIPMIKPYEMQSYNAGVDWFFELPPKKKCLVGQQIHYITQIGIYDSLILFHTDMPNRTDNFPLDRHAWFILDTETKKEIRFTSEVSYKLALDSMRIGAVKLYDINKVFSDFGTTGKWPAEWPKEAHE